MTSFVEDTSTAAEVKDTTTNSPAAQINTPVQDPAKTPCGCDHKKRVMDTTWTMCQNELRISNLRTISWVLMVLAIFFFLVFTFRQAIK